MFACIYFVEDASLTVVSKNDKNLSVENFAEKSRVSMKWKGRNTYHGTIVKIHGKFLFSF